MIERTIIFALGIAFALTVLAQDARAEGFKPDTMGAHVASVHSEPGFNNFNPGAYAKWDGWTAGAYYNSERRLSVYGGYTFETPEWKRLRAALTVGAITGYAARDVMPLAVPSVALRLDDLTSVRVAFVPKIQKDGAHALHLMLEKRL